MTTHCKNCRAETPQLSPRRLCGVCEYCKAKEAEAQRDAARLLLHKLRRLVRSPSTTLSEMDIAAIKCHRSLPLKRSRALTLAKRWDRIKQLLETP